MNLFPLNTNQTPENAYQIMDQLNKQIDNLETRVRELLSEQQSIGSSTNARWQQLDAERFRLQDEISRLIKLSHIKPN